MKRPRLGRGLADLTTSAPGAAWPPVADIGRRADVAAEGSDAGRRPVILCISSGKGGTGKSVLTSNLAVHLAATGVRAMTIDADLGLANLHLLLGVRPTRTILDVIERGIALAQVAEFGPMGVWLAAGASGMPEMADMHPERLRRLIAAMEAVGDAAEVLLVDTGAGIGRATTSFLYSLPEILVVTTPDLTAMTDAYAVIKNVARNNGAAKLSLVVNRAASAVEGLEIFGRMDRICRKFLSRSLLYLGHVLEDPRIPASIAARVPILLNQPAAPAAACLRGVGRALMLEVGALRAAAMPRVG